MEPLVLAEDLGAVRRLTLNRPDKLNALDRDLMLALLDALDAAATDPGVHVVVLRGAGRAFCSGYDLAADADAIIAAVPALKAHRDEIAGRAMLCRRGTVFPIECVIRGYLSGSAWREYKASQTLAGEKMPDGLSESIRLDTPIFSPATKAESGHDENITVGRMREVLGAEVTAELERLTRIVYGRGRDVALKQGIIIADTKFEFGRTKEGEILLIDEVMTPDSSRFWPLDGYEPGRPQPSFDKQPLRDWLDVERHAGRWNGDAPAPKLPPEVVDATSKRYLEAYRRLTGSELKVS